MGESSAPRAAEEDRGWNEDENLRGGTCVKQIWRGEVVKSIENI